MSKDREACVEGLKLPRNRQGNTEILQDCRELGILLNISE